MNRGNRKKTGKLRKAALSLLVAGALAAGGAPELYDVSADAASDIPGTLKIQGGGGGGGQAGCNGNPFGGGGGGYVVYAANGVPIVQFGGGGDGQFWSFSDPYGRGGSIGGGDNLGGRSGTFLNNKGDGGRVSNSERGTDNYDPARRKGVEPVNPSSPSFPFDVDTFLGGSVEDEDTIAGAGGGARVKAVNLQLGSLTVISGEGGGGIRGGGVGGPAAFKATEELDAKIVTLQGVYADIPYPTERYAQPAGQVEFDVGTYAAGKEYTLAISEDPNENLEISIGALKFDLTDVANGNVLLTATNQPFNLDWVEEKKEFNFINNGLVPGNRVVLIDNVIGYFEPVTVFSNGDHFRVEKDDDQLVATVWVTVTFDANGGEGTMKSKGIPRDENFPIPLNLFTRQYHTFAGWNTEANGSGTYYADKATINKVHQANIKLYAQWTPEKRTIIFNSNGGEGTMVNDSVDHGGNFVIPANAFTKESHTHTGWRTTADESGTFYLPGARIDNVQDDITLYAQWKLDTYTYTVTFDRNNGEGEMADRSVDHGEDFKIPRSEFTRANYTFTGWDTAADGSGDAYAPGATIKKVEHNITLYAQWEQDPLSYTVTFNPNGGRGGMPDVGVSGGDDFVVPDNEFTRTSFTFIEWNTEVDGSGDAYAPGATIKKVEHNITLYAQWEQDPLSYTVTFNPNGGRGGMPDVGVAGGDDFVVPGNGFSRTDHTFTGWNTEADGSGIPYAPGETMDDIRGNITLYAQWMFTGSEIDVDCGGCNAGAGMFQMPAAACMLYLMRKGKKIGKEIK